MSRLQLGTTGNFIDRIPVSFEYRDFEDNFNHEKPVWDMENLPPLEKNFYQETAATRDRPQVSWWMGGASSVADFIL